MRFVSGMISRRDEVPETVRVWDGDVVPIPTFPLVVTMKLVAVIPVGKSPHGVFFTPRAGWE